MYYDCIGVFYLRANNTKYKQVKKSCFCNNLTVFDMASAGLFCMQQG